MQLLRHWISRWLQLILLMLLLSVCWCSQQTHIGKHRATVHTDTHSIQLQQQCTSKKKNLHKYDTERGGKTSSSGRDSSSSLLLVFFLLLRLIYGHHLGATAYIARLARQPDEDVVVDDDDHDDDELVNAFGALFFAGKRRLGLVWYLRTFQCFSFFFFFLSTMRQLLKWGSVCFCMGKTVSNSLELLL